MRTRWNPLPDSSVALAAVTAFLYCVSSAYTGGFNNRLALDGDVLDRNFQQVLYSGFMISFGRIFLALLTYVFLRILYSHAVLPGINDALRKNWKRKRFFLKHKHRWFAKRMDSELEKKAKTHTLNAATIAGIGYVLLLTLLYFEIKGKEAASQVLSKLEHNSFLPHELVMVTVNGEAKKILYLSCGARNCAGVDPKTRVVHYFPQNGHSYLLPNEKAKRSTVSPGRGSMPRS